MVLGHFHTLEPYPDVAPGLQLIRDAGVRVMTLTVGDVALSEGLFARAGLRHMVDGFLSADTVRRWANKNMWAATLIALGGVECRVQRTTHSVDLRTDPLVLDGQQGSPFPCGLTAALMRLRVLTLPERQYMHYDFAL